MYIYLYCIYVMEMHWLCVTFYLYGVPVSVFRDVTRCFVFILNLVFVFFFYCTFYYSIMAV